MSAPVVDINSVEFLDELPEKSREYRVAPSPYIDHVRMSIERGATLSFPHLFSTVADKDNGETQSEFMSVARELRRAARQLKATIVIRKVLKDAHGNAYPVGQAKVSFLAVAKND